MDWQAWVDSLVEAPVWILCLSAFFGAAIEYVLPPLPGDALVFGALALASIQSRWPIAVGLAALAGISLGVASNWVLGRMLARALANSNAIARMAGGAAVPVVGVLARFRARLESHVTAPSLQTMVMSRGDTLLLLHRLVPGLRGLIIIACAIHGMSFGRVLGLACVGGVVWAGLLAVVASFTGQALRALDVTEVVAEILRLQWWLVGIVLAAGLVFMLTRRVKRTCARAHRSRPRT